MTYDEYSKSLTEALSNPDTALTSVSPLLEELKKDLDGLETLRKDVEAKDARIRDLQDTNLKLFLSQTSPVKKDEDEVTKEQKAVDEFFSDFNK